MSTFSVNANLKLSIAWELHSILPTFKDVELYGAASLYVGTLANAPLCNSLYLFLPSLCRPYNIIISNICINYQ